MARYGIWRGLTGGLEPADRERIDDAITVSDNLGAVIGDVEQARDIATGAASTSTTQAGVALDAAGLAVVQADAAGVSAGLAGQRAGDADDAAALSAQERAAAEAARTASETYATSAGTAARFFPTIALGRAAVTDGQTFGVEKGGADGLEFATTYRRDSATAHTPIVPLASAFDVVGKISKVPDVKVGPTLGAAFAVDFNEGETRSFEVGLDGRTRTGDLRSEAFEAASVASETAEFQQVLLSQSLLTSAPSGWHFAIPDGEGNLAAGLREDGVFCVKEIQTTVPIVGVVPGEPTAPVILPEYENRPEDTIQGIMHRGYSGIAPENTLPAYVAAARAGRYVVECDIQWTADGVAVLLHDATIDRTVGGTGTGTILSMTLAEARAFDYSNGRAGYMNTPIPTFREFMLLCKRLNLYAYCELKSSNWTADQVAQVLAIIGETGMRGRVELDCFTQAPLVLVAAADPKQRIGRLGTMSETMIANCVALQTGQNVVAAAASAASVTVPLVAAANAAGVPVVVWTVDNAASVPALAAMGLSGIMTNTLNINAIIRASEGI